MPSWDHEDLKGSESAKINRDAPRFARPTGKTTAMLRAAATLEATGANILLVGATHAHAHNLALDLSRSVHESKIVSHVGLDGLRSKMLGSDFVPMVDHHALEVLLDQLDSYKRRLADAQIAFEVALQVEREERRKLQRENISLAIDFDIANALVRELQREAMIGKFYD